MLDSCPIVIDLFAGVGGLSLGAARAGFDVIGAVENDPIAIASHTRNFPQTFHINEDIRTLTGASLLKKVGLKNRELTGLIGGPPCQGFSNMGHRNGRDTRSFLFYHFFRLVSEIEPAFFIAENVPGILHAKFEKKRSMAFGKIPSNYRILEPFTVIASAYGAPTSRTRVFFAGYDPVRVNGITENDFLPPLTAEQITVADALAGLPQEISDEWEAESAEWRTVTKFNGTDYMARVTGVIPQGVGDLSALAKYDKNGLVSGCQGTRHVRDVVQRFRSVKPGDTDPVSRAPRLSWTGLCPTLRAGTASDRGSFQAIRPIHPSQPRVITPREAARLQGFPDWFMFHHTKWHSFRQIGNSVSPIVAEYLLTRMRSVLL
jgi:DNA (cytosine-5)-methyltransferase 1